MYQVSYNKEKNRIYMTFKGRISKEEVRQYEGELLGVLGRVHSHFTVCVNAGEMNSFSPSLYSEFIRLKQHCEAKQMKSLAVVVPYKVYQLYRRRLEREIGNIFINQEEAELFLNTI